MQTKKARKTALVLLKRAGAMSLLCIDLITLSTMSLLRMMRCDDIHSREVHDTMSQSIVSLEDRDNPLQNQEILMLLAGTFYTMKETAIEHNGAQCTYKYICDLYKNHIRHRHSIFELCMYDVDTITAYCNNTKSNYPSINSEYSPHIFGDIYASRMLLGLNSGTMLIDSEYLTSSSSLRMTSQSDRLEIYYEEHNSFGNKLDHFAVANQYLVPFAFLGLFILSTVMVTKSKRTTNHKCIQPDGSTSRTRIKWDGFISSIGIDR